MKNWVIICALFVAPCFGEEGIEGGSQDDSAYGNFQIFAQALQIIRQDYFEQSQTSYRMLVYSALRGILSALDPHSEFLEPQDFKEMQDDTKGEFGGLGAVVTMENGILTVVTPMEDSPCFDAGIEPGDQILSINGRTTEGLSLPEAIELMRGDVGDKVTMSVRSAATGRVKRHELVRQTIKVSTVKDAQILPSPDGRRIGYVRITQFSEPTSLELRRALEKIQAEGAEGLIMDLRFNPGGLLSSVVEVCGYFLPPGTLVVSTEGRSLRRTYETMANSEEMFQLPLVVLVNHASASGAEVLAGAMKDLERAIIVGETTFGKGSVQSVVGLPDGSAVRLTTAKYFTPKREIIHERGVVPHVKAVATREEEVEILKLRRAVRGAVMSGEEMLRSDGQLARGVDILRGLLLYLERGAES